MKTILGLLLTTTALLAQLDPAKLFKAPTDSWPSHNGDVSGRRFSPLTKVNDKNVPALSLAWVHRINAAPNGIFGGAIKATPVVVFDITKVLESVRAPPSDVKMGAAHRLAKQRICIEEGMTITASANAKAAARPMPRPPPVTKATLPVSAAIVANSRAANRPVDRMNASLADFTPSTFSA